MSLLIKSRQIKREADRLLDKTGLLEFLESKGEINFVGSYSYDLMIDGDIDLHIVNPIITKSKSINILNELIKANKFRGYLYYDFTTRRRLGFPKGYYIGLKTKFKGRKWKIDIWFLKKMGIKSNMISELVKNNLNLKNKSLILSLKNIVKSKKLLITSVAIYQAVFLKNIKNIADLKKINN